MKKRLSLTARMVVTTSLLLIVISILFTVFSLFNAYFNLIQPLQALYGQQTADVLLNADNFFAANLIFMAAAIAVGCMLTCLAAKFSLKPLKSWSREIAAIDQNQLSKRIQQPNTRDELDALVSAFNQLLDRLQRAFDREKRFSAAVAHELKTPLTVVKTNIEFLQLDDSPEPADYAETIAIVQKQNERMIRLVRDLSSLFSSNAQQHDMIDLDRMIDEIEKDLTPSLLAKHIRFTSNHAGFQMAGNAVLMKHALSNLIENAIKYNVAGGAVQVRQTAENGGYELSVSDTGIGIEAEDAPYIFEPFYRADKSRNRAAGGSGLGLAIAKDIIETHGGRIRFQAREPQGSIFTVAIPSRQPSP